MKNTRDWFNESQWIEYGDGSGTPVITCKTTAKCN